MVDKLSKVWYVAQYSYLDFIHNGRNLFFAFVLFLMSGYIAVPFARLSSIVNVPLNIVEPFLAAMNSPFSAMFIGVIILMIFGDFPKMEGNNGYILIRVSRNIWFLGMLLFHVMASVTFIAVLFGAMTVRAASQSFFANGWSYIMKDYYKQYEMLGVQTGVRVDCVIQDSMYNNYTPFEALGWTLLFLFCVILVMVLIMMMANFLKKKMIGMLLNVVMVVIGAVLNFLYHPLSKWFPIGNMMLVHQNKAAYVLIPIEHQFRYFIVLIAVLLIVNYILLRKCNIEKDGEK